MLTNSISILINTISFFSCILVFAVYPQTKQKSIGFRMILTLCISDFLLAAINLFHSLCFLDSFACYYLSYLNYLIANFSLIWSTTIALISYLSVKSQITWTSRQIFWTSFIASLTLASFLASMFSKEIIYSALVIPEEELLVCNSSSPLISPSKDLIKFYIFEVLVKILLILTTFLCYANINSKLQQAQHLAHKAKMSRLKWYPICQIILYGPILINEIAKVGFARHDENIDQAVVWLFQLAGAINSTTYILQRTEFKRIFRKSKSFDHSLRFYDRLSLPNDAKKSLLL